MNLLIRLAVVVLSFPLTGRGGSVAHVIFCVKDDDGMVVTNARVGMSTIEKPVRVSEFGESELPRVEGRTDTNGLVSLTLASQYGNLAVHVKPMSGFYYDQGVRIRMTNAVGGRWEPWGQTNVLVVRRIVNPIPMYARAFGGSELMVPENGKPVGFDLMKGDWVAPYGKGEVPDFVFTVRWKSYGRNESRHLRYEAQMELTFGSQGDGLFEVHVPYHAPPRGSVYRMPRMAPEDGYAPKYARAQFRSDNARSPELPQDMNYFFRIRTRRNADGEITTALYGKIHGCIQFGVVDAGACIEMGYYLNPTPNDRNTEFDPKRNLFKLESFQRINDP